MSHFASLGKWEIPLDFSRNIACKRTSTNVASLPLSRVLGAVADTCPVGTRSAVIQAGTDEYSRVALRWNESFEFIRMVAHRLFFAIAGYVSERDYVFARNTEIRLPAVRIILSFTRHVEKSRIEPFEREDSLETLPSKKMNYDFRATINTRIFLRESIWKFVEGIEHL